MAAKITNKDYETFGWKMTDGSTHQYGRRISDNVYEFKEVNHEKHSNEQLEAVATEHNLNPHEYLVNKVWDKKTVWDNNMWVSATIDLKDYTEAEMEEEVSGYYNGLGEVKDTYGDDWKWIVAECIFEQMYDELV